MHKLFMAYDPYDLRAIELSRTMARGDAAAGRKGAGPVSWAYEETYKKVRRDIELGDSLRKSSNDGPLITIPEKPLLGRDKFRL